MYTKIWGTQDSLLPYRCIIKVANSSGVSVCVREYIHMQKKFMRKLARRWSLCLSFFPCHPPSNSPFFFLLLPSFKIGQTYKLIEADILVFRSLSLSLFLIEVKSLGSFAKKARLKTPHFKLFTFFFFFEVKDDDSSPLTYAYTIFLGTLKRMHMYGTSSAVAAANSMVEKRLMATQRPPPLYPFFYQKNSHFTLC